MKLLARVLIILILPLAAAAQTSRPVPQIRHAMIISIDGLRPDVLLRADAPRIHALAAGGSFTYWARTTMQSTTLPSHASMLTGCTPEVHGILWNGELPFSKPVYPNAPMIFELAKKAGYSTAALSGKTKFDLLNKPGTIDYADFPASTQKDDIEVARHVYNLMRRYKPDVVFVHLANVDVVGHAKGWGSPEQMSAVANADRAVGQILDALEEFKLLDSTLIILTTDHGGSGKTHGPDDIRSRQIPWIAAGPGIRKGYDLTLDRDLVVDVQDTCPTVCALLDIPLTKKVNGKFIEQILEDRQLLKTSEK